MTQDLDAWLRQIFESFDKIFESFDIRRRVDGELLTCSSCGKSASYTYGRVCGECWLQGKRPILS